MEKKKNKTTKAKKTRKTGKKILYVTKSEHAKWHKENGSCGTGKEHEECMKNQGIVIRG
jgi:hypothetical protein